MLATFAYLANGATAYKAQTEQHGSGYQVLERGRSGLFWFLEPLRQHW
jgi:hypothetical protein